MKKQLEEIYNHYQKEFDQLKDQRDKLKSTGVTDVALIEERMNALCSGMIALNKVEQLKHIDGSKDVYTSAVVYQKERNKIFKSQLI